MIRRRNPRPPTRWSQSLATALRLAVLIATANVLDSCTRSFVHGAIRSGDAVAAGRSLRDRNRSPIISHASGIELFDLLTPPVGALNAESAAGLRGLVWADFYFAVAFFVFTPLALLFWGLWSSIQTKAQDDEVLRVIVGYWQASSMLLITVLLNIAGLPIGATTGLVAQVMIPVSLWFWSDLNERIAPQTTLLPTVFRVWRLVATVGAIAGAIALFPYSYCSGVASLAADAGCAAWIEAPKAFYDIFLPFVDTSICGDIGLLGLAIYTVYSAYLVTVILPTIGRSGLATRPSFTWIQPLEWLGLVAV